MLQFERRYQQSEGRYYPSQWIEREYILNNGAFTVSRETRVTTDEVVYSVFLSVSLPEVSFVQLEVGEAGDHLMGGSGWVGCVPNRGADGDSSKACRDHLGKIV
jgi:hypothetical protein